MRSQDRHGAARRADRKLAARRWLHLHPARITIKTKNPAHNNQKFDSDTPDTCSRSRAMYRLQGHTGKTPRRWQRFWQSRSITTRTRQWQQISSRTGQLRDRRPDGRLRSSNHPRPAGQREHISTAFTTPRHRQYVTWGSNDNYGTPRSYMLTAKYKFLSRVTPHLGTRKGAWTSHGALFFGRAK